MILKLFLIAFPVFLLIDMLWLGVIAKNFYYRQIGSLIKKRVNWSAAIIFYGLFVFGLVFFVIVPAVESISWVVALFRGSLFGLITYATYDLTNLSTLNNWPLKLTIVDILWGVVLASLVSIITYFISITWII
ncbi:MAG TPA: DUF2177 family protein [Patescibacteria group bacterium]|nr:DUF2177 family protein [Patescibacteria group bacterium]